VAVWSRCATTKTTAKTYRESGEHSVVHHGGESLLYAGDVLLGYGPSLHLGSELEAGSGLTRLKPDLHVGVLSVAATLLLVRVLDHNLLGDALAVVHLRLAHVAFHLELATEAVHDDLQVELAHAFNNCLGHMGAGAQG
jgi:hypothetical protein